MAKKAKHDREDETKNTKKENKYKKNQKEDSEEEQVNMGKEILSTVIYAVCVCAIVFLIIHFVGQRTVVRGDSMDNTLLNGQNLIMDKISYRFNDPERFDIVIFPGPEESGEHPYYIKRVIGLPGETVQIKDGKTYINGKELTSDKYGITDYIDEPGIAAEPLTLSDDEYFCMGDNRPISYDSRYEAVGPVTKEEIIGKVWIRIWPLNQFGTVTEKQAEK